MNDGERMNCDFQFGKLDKYSFYGLIIMALYKADPSNESRMKLAYPLLTESVKRWKTEEGYANRLTEEYRKERGC